MHVQDEMEEKKYYVGMMWFNDNETSAPKLCLMPAWSSNENFAGGAAVFFGF